MCAPTSPGYILAPPNHFPVLPPSPEPGFDFINAFASDDEEEPYEDLTKMKNPNLLNLLTIIIFTTHKPTSSLTDLDALLKAQIIFSYTTSTLISFTRLRTKKLTLHIFRCHL